MKTKTKKLVALSLTATLCGALATVATFANGAEASANTTPTFKMADGAGIRYTVEDGKKEGLRFIVLADETTKDAIVASGQLGAIISIADDFTGIDGDYLNCLDEMQYETNAQFDVTNEMFYQNAEEYGDLYCANIVINMGTNDTVENFTERTYSAVAYYATGTDTYAYTENRQERSIQDVASKLYMQSDADWAKVSETYTALGTESTPFLVAQDGDNSYAQLVENLATDINFGADYAFELESDVEIDSKILDGESASDIINASGFDTTKKYDSQSNGSYKIDVEVSGTETAQGTVDYKINPAKSKADYKAMQLVGYDYIAIRFMAENYEGQNTVGLRYINTTTSEMYIYQDNVAITSLSAGSTIWQNHLLNMSNGKWGEMVFDINKFVNASADGMTLLQAYANKGEANSFSMDLYIDNVYAVKGFIGETKETVYQDKGTTYTNTDRICTVTVDGKDVAVENNAVTLDTYGVYTVKETTRDTYGYVAQTVIPNGTVVSKLAENFSAKHNTDTSSFTITKDSQTQNVTVGGAGQIDAAWRRTTYTIKTVADKTYYEQLQTNGFIYITYEFTLNADTEITGDIYRFGLTSTQAPHWNSLTETNSGYSKRLLLGGSIYDTETKPSGSKYLDSLSGETWRGKTCIVSIHIADFIRLYNTTGMNILTLQFVSANADLDYSVTFGQIAATKNACSFD